MQVHDKRSQTDVPLPSMLQRVLGAVVAGAAELESAKPQGNELRVVIVDHETKAELWVPRLVLNFQPVFLSERVWFWWKNVFNASLNVKLVKNAEEVESWSVWEE